MKSILQGIATLIGGVLFILLFIWLGQSNNELIEQRSRGVVIEKTAEPAWISSEDNYYFVIRFDSDEVMKKKVDHETYMKTNVGDRINWNPY